MKATLIAMTWTVDEVRETIQRLRERAGDFTDIAVKSGHGGTPDLGETLSAFGNMPEGGTIILGLAENDNFASVGVHDVQLIMQGIAAQARTAVKPPVQLAFTEVRIDDRPIVIADVRGLPLKDRPCMHAGRAYLRQADGDYPLSLHELQQIERLKLANTERPRDDLRPVDGTTEGDLDPALRAAFITSVRSSSARLSGVDDTTLLRRKCVLEANGPRLTLAGLYALGQYPQQFEPSLSITAAVQLPSSALARTRDLLHLDGPLPDMLDQALDWTRRNTSTQIRYDATGHARDEYEFPARAVRELVANALVHRDLSAITDGKRVEIRLTEKDLVVSSPGGLRGITVRQLGDPFGKSAVNQFLYEITKFTWTRDGARVIEGEGGGIREIRSSLQSAGLRPPVFHDTGVGFIARVPRHAFLASDDLGWLADISHSHRLSDLQRNLLVRLRHGDSLTNRDVRRLAGTDDPAIARTALSGLVAAGLAHKHGSGRGTEYRLAGETAEALDQLRIEIEPPARSVAAGLDNDLTVRTGEAGSFPDPSHITKHGRIIYECLSSPRTLAELTFATSLDAGQVRYAIRRLIAAGLLEMSGEQGKRGTTYARTHQRSGRSQ